MTMLYKEEWKHILSGRNDVKVIPVNLLLSIHTHVIAPLSYDFTFHISNIPVDETNYSKLTLVYKIFHAAV